MTFQSCAALILPFVPQIGAAPVPITTFIPIVEVIGLDGITINSDQSLIDERVTAYDSLQLPHNVTAEQAIYAVTKANFLSSWQAGEKIVTPHRGDVGVHSGHFYPDLSMSAIRRVFMTWGLNSVEVDISPTKNSTFVLAHERNANRVVGMPVEWADLFEEDITELLLGFRPINDEGVLTNAFYPSDQRITSLKRFLTDEIRCIPGANVILDARDREDPVLAIAHLSRLPDLRDSVAVQLYNLAFNNASELVAEVEKLIPDKDWKENVMIIPVFRHEGIHKVAGVSEDNFDFDALAFAAFNWIESWTEAGLRIPGYGLPVQGGFRFVNPKTHRVDEDLFRNQFHRNPTNEEKAVLVKDHLLSVMITERKRCEPQKFIVVPSCLPTTNADGKLFRVRFPADSEQAEAMDLLDPISTVKDWMFMQASKPGAAFQNGADICITDQTSREISHNAYIQRGLNPPEELLDAMYPPFSQESFLDTIVSKLQSV